MQLQSVRPNAPARPIAFWVRALWIVFAVYTIGVVLLMFIGQQFWGYSFDQQQTPDNLWLTPFVLALLCGLALLSRRADGVNGSPYRRLLAFQLCFLVFQCGFVYCTRFYVISESYEAYCGAYALARGRAVDNVEFFRMYPHNAPNALLTSYIIRLAWLLGLKGFNGPRELFPYIGALLLNLLTGLTAVIVYRLTKRRVLLWIAAVVGAVWLGLSQFMMVPYSDLYCVLFPVLALWALTSGLRAPIKWFLFSLFCFFGGAIRPTVLILWIACTLCGLCRAVHQRVGLRRFARQALLLAAVSVTAFLPAQLWKTTAVTALAGSSDPQEAFTVTHYLMMGANERTLGEFDNKDVEFSQSFPTVAERQAANLSVVRERLLGMSPRELLKLAIIKLYKPNADGNFYCDATMCEYQPPRSDAVSLFLRELYMLNGRYHRWYVSLQQIIWLAVLVLVAVCALSLRRQPYLACVTALAVLGLAAYNLLGENWPRYLFVFAPLYLILAMLGLNEGFGKRSRGRRRDERAAPSNAAPSA